MTRIVVTLLGVPIVALFAAAVLAQVVFIPWIAWAEAQDFPEVAYLAVPQAATFIVAVGALTLVLVVMRGLLRLAVEHKAEFDEVV